MALPTRIFTIELRRIEGIPTSHAGQAYAVAWIAGRFFGRSRVIPSGADSIDLTAEPTPWRLEVRVPDMTPSWRVEVWDDRGDRAPYALVSLRDTLNASYEGGDLTLGTNQRVIMHVDRRDVPTAARAVVPRVPHGERTRATVAVPNTLIVEVTDVRGLYKPGHRPSGVDHPRRSERLAGYRSEDDRGRIFLNRDLAGAYTRDTQLIELAARVTVVRGALPSGAKVKWKVVDPDDPFDGQPTVHRDSAHLIDPRDYDATSHDPTGMRDNDNEGTPDHSPVWEAVSGFSLDVVSSTEAKTSIVSNESKVVLHCPNVAGDNLIVRAEIDSPVTVEVFPGETGVMTLWHRVDVEYVKMTSAFDLPVATIPDFFEQACAQLDIAEPTVVADQAFIASSNATKRRDSHTFIDTKAAHAREPGWFHIVSAMEAHPPPTGSATSSRLFTGDVTLRNASTATSPDPLVHEYITIRGNHRNAFTVRFDWDGRNVGFIVESTVHMVLSGVDYTRIWLSPHDLTFDFSAGDGSLSHAYANQHWWGPRFHHNGSAWVPGGYGIPERVHCRVDSAGSGITAGTSPAFEVSGQDYFCGRTLIFTHHPGFRDRLTGTPRGTFAAEVLAALAHELVHAFGMPHKCGYFDHRTPRAQACHMNYDWVGMLDTTDTTRILAPAPIGANLCGNHLKQVRLVHLEDNGALHSWGW